jgi:hypothetical protein
MTGAAMDVRARVAKATTWIQYGDDLAKPMNYLDLKDATMVGHSTGGGEVVR